MREEEMRITTQCRRVFVITIVFVFVEWLLFELVRMPYSPPRDMTTFLGTEKYDVIRLMAAIACGWLIYIILSGLSIPFGRREYLNLGLLFVALIAIVMVVVFFPLWPVTPFELINH